jgi:hypothetical protein
MGPRAPSNDFQKLPHVTCSVALYPVVSSIGGPQGKSLDIIAGRHSHHATTVQTVRSMLLGSAQLQSE